MENKTEEKKITANDTICLMLSAIGADKRDQFYKAAELYLDTLAPGGNWHYKIKNILRSRPMQFTRLDALSNDIKRLVLQSPVDENVNVFLPEGIKDLLGQLLIEWQNAEAYRYHNLGVRDKILLHGPTGNGKTTIGRYIAKQANLPFVEVNSDLMIDSHIGNTSANIHKLFQGIQQACVLFWDEVDSIGCQRGGNISAAGMENDRMVNSVLVNLEKMYPGVIFIGATNRKDILDPAFVRRFHEIIEVPAPTHDEKIAYFRKLTDYYKMPALEGLAMVRLDSYSAIKTAYLSAARQHVAKNLNSFIKAEQPCI